MASRHNLCINPVCKNDVVGWGGNGSPVEPDQADVTGDGLPRNTAARYTRGSFARTAPTNPGAITEGVTYTFSFYMRTHTFNTNGTVYVGWLKENGTEFGYPQQSFNAVTGVVLRVSITAVAPAEAVAANLIVDGGYVANTTDFTALLFEQVASLDSYFDGDTVPGGSWDGTPGNSASTFSPATNVDLGQPSETDTGQPFSRLKTRALGLAPETDTAQVIAQSKTRMLGQPVETDTALPLVPAKARALGQPAETEAALPLTRVKSRVLGIAVETDAALPLDNGATVQAPRAVTVTAAASATQSVTASSSRMEVQAS